MKKIITDINNNIYIKEDKIKLRRIKNYIENKVIRVYESEEITTWLGMGGAITNSAAYNYSLLNDEQKKELINSYYSEEGLNYSNSRICIASSDFSTHHFEYSKKSDLSDFNINEDKKYVIPLLQDIFNIKNVNLIASPWSPPKYMKTILFKKLKKKYYSLYAKYLKLFIDAYQDLGFDISYITMQNEPLAYQKWESCTFTLEEQSDFIYNYLVKALNKSNTKILLWDHNRELLYDVFKYLYKENKSIAGIAYHWYSGSHFNNINLIRKNYPNTLLINSEMCCGYSKYNEQNWISDAKLYLIDIINNMNSGCNMYLDWNILLDSNGGPNHKKNYCKSPIILGNNNLIKTPIYYFLYHISKHKVNSKLLINSSYDNDLLICSSIYNNEITITILNKSDDNKEFNLILEDNYINDKINKNSVITYII